jgi:hypothetical protein
MTITSSDIKNAVMIMEYKNKYGFYPKNNSYENKTKTEYRTVEHIKLKTISNIINIIYYSFLIILFMLLFSSNNVFIEDRWYIYLFLIILPYVYPWIFIGLIKLKNMIFVNDDNKPIGAFIDTGNYNNLNYNI